MFDAPADGILYTEHTGLVAAAPGIASLWSFATRPWERGRPKLRRTPQGSCEYWLERSDPLLNTILPGTGVSLVVNFADLWAAGRSLATSALLPRVCAVGPITQARILRVGRTVHAAGVGLPSSLTPIVFGVAASDLVDQIVPLQDLWPGNDVERILAFSQFETGRCVSALKDELVARIRWADRTALLGQTAPGIIKRHAGNISIEDLASNHGLTRQRFARTFTASTGLSPKLFARITRFQALVHALLSTDVSQWASMSSAVGFYDQAHMINEFRTFTGFPPRVFFLPHGANIDLARVQLHGRPSEWSYQLDQRTERASA